MSGNASVVQDRWDQEHDRQIPILKGAEWKIMSFVKASTPVINETVWTVAGSQMVF